MRWPDNQIASLALAFMAVAVPYKAGAAAKWYPVEPREAAMSAPIVEADADAEALFWEVSIEDSWTGASTTSADLPYYRELVVTHPGILTTRVSHYLRIKIFTEHGREMQAKVAIPVPRDGRIDDIVARTIGPDGTVTELPPGEVHERTLSEGGDPRRLVKLFTLPGVRVGSIVEYRWRESRFDARGVSGVYDLQRDIPVQRLTYRIKPVNVGRGGVVQTALFRAAGKFSTDPFGNNALTLNNLPAFRNEPEMPPPSEVRSWLLVYYPSPWWDDAESYWRSIGQSRYRDDSAAMDASPEVREAASRIVGDAVTTDLELERLHVFCRAKIRNLEADKSSLSEERRAQPTDHKHSRETLAAGKGTARDVRILFGSLARALGFDARLAYLGHRERGFIQRELMVPLFMSERAVAVRIGDSWRFYDPALAHTPAGMLPWQLECQEAMIPDSSGPLWVRTPVTPAEVSRVARTGAFRVTADGTLEGGARIELSGQQAIRERERFSGLAPESLTSAVRKEVQELLPAATVVGVRIENLQDPEVPLVCSYSLRVPSYARPGKGLLVLNPSLFQLGRQARFVSSTRRNAIFLDFPWSEYDSLTIELPPGYGVDRAESESPGTYALGEVGEHDVRLATAEDGNVLIYRRRFDFRRLVFRSEEYETLKSVFDAVQERDARTVTIRQAMSPRASPDRTR